MTRKVVDISIEPVTRVAGALAFHTKVDLGVRRVIEAHSVPNFFRGYEIIIRGRDPADAMVLSSRACGVCGAVHMTCSVMAVKMAAGVTPPPLATVMRNMGETAEFIYDNPLHLYLLAGPDYSEIAVSKHNPEIWQMARETKAPHSDIHGFPKISDLMEALNPLSGRLYLEAFEITRIAREAVSLVYGKYPHPSTIVPGGLSTTITIGTFNGYYTRLIKLLDYIKKLVYVWEDLTEFFYKADPMYMEVGRRPLNMITTGIFDDYEVYDGTYENAGRWGEARYFTPGVILDGQLVTTDLIKINLGVEEFVEHSYYEEWDVKEPRFKEDPLGNPLSPYHPWNEDTKPKPVARNWREKYSWTKAPRWDRKVVETNPVVRLWVTALAGKVNRDLIKSGGGKIVITLPKGAATPEMEIEWKSPKILNAFERNRGRAYHAAYVAAIAFMETLRAYDLLKKGRNKTWTGFEKPMERRLSVGFWGAGRDWLTHHMVVNKWKVENYQIITPSTWNSSPRDPWGQPGPYEQAVMNTPILEKFSSPDDYKGLDVLRAIRSFDSCMPCAVHIEARGRILKAEATTCGCSL